MKSEVLSKFTEIWLPSTALLIFLSIFIIMLVYIFLKTSKENFEQAEKIPFDEGMKK